MEPHLHFLTGEDGERVTYGVLGTGPALVYVPPWGASNIDLDFKQPAGRAFFERLAERRTVVYVVRRSVGHADGEPPDVSLSVQVQDVCSVADRLDLDTCDVWAADDGCAIGVAFAAARAPMVRHIVLWSAYARAGGSEHRVVKSLVEMAHGNWALMRRTFADVNFPTGPDELRRWFADYHRASYSPGVTASFLAYSADADMRPHAGQIDVPVLFLHRRGDNNIALRAGKSAASLFKRATLMVLEGDIHIPFFGDTSYLSAVEAFLDDLPMNTATQREPAPAARSSVRTVLFTDLVGHTEMMQRLGDARGREVLREHERITRETLLAHNGIEIKTDGDSFMVSFASVASAVECAIALQRAFAAREGEPLNVRIGLNAGEPIEDEGDLYGATVILAARIKEKAGAGEILIPETVRGLLSGKGFVFADRGEFVPKGFEDGVRLFEVRWRD
jgi:class 3 adenylate cyclase/pimeloyl-ACP methyl ester carboxylesterase